MLDQNGQSSQMVLDKTGFNVFVAQHGTVVLDSGNRSNEHEASMSTSQSKKPKIFFDKKDEVFGYVLVGDKQQSICTPGKSTISV